MSKVFVTHDRCPPAILVNSGNFSAFPDDGSEVCAWLMGCIGAFAVAALDGLDRISDLHEINHKREAAELLDKLHKILKPEELE